VSQENVELATAAFAAYNGGGMESVLEYFDPDVELIAPPQWLEDRILRGHAGPRQIQDGWDVHFDALRTDVTRIIDVGDE
jgi:ketosteroid isomerase-like protein